MSNERTENELENNFIHNSMDQELASWSFYAGGLHFLNIPDYAAMNFFYE